MDIFVSLQYQYIESYHIGSLNIDFSVYRRSQFLLLLILCF